MSFKKEIELGSVGKVVLTEEAGVVCAELSLSESVGGGSLVGVMKGSVSAKAEVDAKLLIDAGLELAKIKFPAVASLIDGAKVAIDAELAKV